MSVLRRCFSVSLFGLVMLQVSGAQAQNWQNVDKINKWFDDHAGKKYEIQQGGEIGKPGTFQKPGDIQIPKGQAAIRTIPDKDKCKHRLVVHADTLFEFDKATLGPDAAAALKLVGPQIAKLGAHPIVIEGHTDAKGNDEYNQGLSERRAERVKNWLLTNRFIGPEATTKGYGKKFPVAPNTNPNGTDNPKGRQLNRRVEIVVDTCTALKPGTGSQSTSLTAGDAIATTSGSTPTGSAAGGSTTGGSSGSSSSSGSGSFTITTASSAELLPYSNPFSAEEMKNGFTNARVTPFDDPKLYFEVTIPNDWLSKPVTVSKEQLAADTQNQVPLAEFGPNDKANAVIEVRYMRVSPEVTPEQLLLTYAQKSGFETVLRQHAEFNGRKTEDALLRMRTADSGETLTRLTVVRRGDYIFMIASSAPAADYDKWRRIFGVAAISFDPVGK
jgi:outer membrane protein OmpA-like peptidoglycan-associated protein